MMPDEQEALSHKHTGLWCVPLASGRIAVFDHPMRPLRAICERWRDVVSLQKELQAAAKAQQLDMEGIDL